MDTTQSPNARKRGPAKRFPETLTIRVPRGTVAMVNERLQDKSQGDWMRAALFDALQRGI